MNRIVCAASAFIVSAFIVGCGSPTKYRPESFADAAAIQKQASGYWKRDGWWSGVPQDIHKIAITEFSVEYVTDNTSKTGASPISILGAAEMVGMGKRKRVFEESFKAQFPTMLYQGFVAALNTEGIEVLPMESVVNHPSFQELSGYDPGKSYKQYGRNTSAKIEVYPVAGLPVVDDEWFKAGDNAKAEGAIVAGTGAQAGIRVRMRVALDDDGRAVLDAGSVIRIMYHLDKSVVWGKDVWYAKERGAIVSKSAMRDDVPVITSKEFKAFQGDVYTIDGPRFQESILRMYPAYARMAAVTLKN